MSSLVKLQARQPLGSGPPQTPNVRRCGGGGNKGGGGGGGNFDRPFGLQQLRALGLVQACAVLKVGLPTRIAYRDLARRLRTSLLPSTLAAFGLVAAPTEEGGGGGSRSENEVVAAGSCVEDDDKTCPFVAALLWAFDVPRGSFRLGRTTAFFRSGSGSSSVFALPETKMAEQGATIVSYDYKD